jgi:very-short-patch-repair endonuclease
MAGEDAGSIPTELRDLFIKRVTEWAVQEIDHGHGVGGHVSYVVADQCESPIEGRLFIELLFAFGRFYAINIRDHNYEDCFNEGRLFDGLSDVSITPQFPEPPYRIDLAAHISSGDAVLKIAIECDGHDFHERTKQQAARDRRRDRVLQQRGWLVFRFTGSEIFNNGRGCALEVANHAFKWQIEQSRIRFAAARKEQEH